MEEQTKECTLCGNTKTFSEFKKHQNARFGLHPRCKSCLNEQQSAYYTKNKDKWREKEVELRTKDPEALRKKNRDAATRWRANPENTRRKRMAYIEKRYGISYEQYEQMEKDQNYRCKICQKSCEDLKSENRKDRLHVDHDHITGEVRGLLCYKCNSALGNLDDDPDRAIRCSAYLRKELS